MKFKNYVTLLLIAFLINLSFIACFNPDIMGIVEIHSGASSPIGEDKVNFGSRFAGGNGTEDDPYRISNVTQLQDMNLDLSANYTLVNDIDASETREWNNGEGFEPIGNRPGGIYDAEKEKFIWPNTFNGTINGKGFSIINLLINTQSMNHIGLFGYIGKNGRVKNIILIDSMVNGSGYVGGLVGTNEGMVKNCTAMGYVTGFLYVGGLVGDNSRLGKIVNCTVKGYITGGLKNVGGLVGYNRGGSITNCDATGDITGNESIAGLVGTNNGLVQNSNASANVTGYRGVSGLVGVNIGIVENCYATSNVTGHENVGGLIGLNWYTGRIENCYATGIITGDVNVGGLVGFKPGGFVKNCYSIGKVFGDEGIGGLIGDDNSFSGFVYNCFWDVNTSGQPYSYGGLSKTSTEMMIKSTFIEAGWDFIQIWDINEYVDYPYFQWKIKSETYPDDSDNDGIPYHLDNFPNDPAAAFDSDYDGYPNSWNDGMDETKSTTGLHLDAFPYDPAASIDSDGDGMPDRWNLGMTQEDSISNPRLELDPYPHDPDNEEPMSARFWVLLIIITLISIALFFVVVLVRKRKRAKDELMDGKK